jgi:hypothetical protein
VQGRGPEPVFDALFRDAELNGKIGDRLSLQELPIEMNCEWFLHLTMPVPDATPASRRPHII